MNLATRKSVELLGMGTEVKVHHRAAIARHRKAYKGYEGKNGWVLVEGTHKEYVNDSCGAQIDFAQLDIETETGLPPTRRFYFYDWPQASIRNCPSIKANKTVMVWPCKQHGWIIGITRRAIGKSESPSGRYDSYYGEYDYDSGGCWVDMYVDLYIVKTSFEGTETFLVPLWGVEKV